MTVHYTLTAIDLIIDLAIFGALAVGFSSKRMPRRWRGTVAVLGAVVLLNFAQSLLALGETPGPVMSAGRVIHAAEIIALAGAVLVFRREVLHPDRLLDRAEARRTVGDPGLDAVPAIVLTMTRDGVVRNVNSHGANLLGSHGKSLIGHEAFRLIPRGSERRRARKEFMLFVGSAGALGAEAEYHIRTAEGLKLVHWRRTAQLDKSGCVVGVVSHGEDITARRATEARLAAESYLLDSVHDAVMVIVPFTECLYFNRAASKMLGMTDEEFKAVPVLDWLTPDSRPLVAQHIETVDRDGDDMLEVVALCKDGTKLPLELRSQRIEFEGKSCAVLVLRDISSRRQAQDLIRKMAFTDSLTGLANRRTVQERLGLALQQLDSNGATLAAIYLDVDNLKTVNDTLGHEAGDRLIRLVGERLSKVLRDSDVVGRVGGDEFVIVIPDAGGIAEIEHVARRLLDHLAEPLKLEGHELCMAASIGIVACEPGQSAEDVLTRADRAMYAAKRAGGGRFRWHSVSMDAELLDRFMLKNDLIQALERDEFVLDFQPIVDANTCKATAAEALLRWQHPSRGLLAPGEFMTLAEQTGIIREIGRWVLKTSCAALAEWRAGGSQLERIAVNVSPLQLTEPYFVADVIATLKEHRLSPDSLELELTETQAMEHSAELDAIFSALNAEGVRLALDDFGVGHSSLERLRRLPIATLKLDRTFVADLCYSSHAHPIIDTVLVLASNLSLNVVAEGVETSCQADYLREAGCSELQGYAFAYPMNAESLIECIKRPLEASSCENEVCLKSGVAVG